ncbi:Gfo/Idh/MocA family protein [Mucilaginibacter sp. KACC 22063]|uniref:Gfo/Idh/MocA family protein n=1 Tax=Mucilaginibacter sp. KACC 22063 TaxID=3025666 RepID=UPI0023669650|nr:Gfo/Idh/MocA family oxidoreductase [Mucilaginibacter sp. KACC 22063]WDF54559.1 Gfo/Idh/MocA family oxidoreductase [Mucilaginibacter sp. KACC 22063]
MVKIGIIGCGRISHRFMQGLAAVVNAQYVGAWARRAENVQEFTAKYGGTAFSSAEELLASDIDAVYIATLPDSHAHYSTLALNAGKHVLCEKPSMVNLQQLEPVLALAKQKNLLFMEGMKPPFFPAYRKLREHLINDPIGDVAYVRAGSSVADLPPDHPNFSYEGIGGGIMAILPYEVFLAAEWLGNTLEMQTLGHIADNKVDMFAIIQSRHEKGYSQLYCGFDLHGKGDALIAGTQGHITIHKNWWNPQKVTIEYLDGRIVTLDEPFAAGGLNYETEHFCQLIQDGKTESPIITHHLSREMMRMLDLSRAQIGLRFPGE